MFEMDILPSATILKSRFFPPQLTLLPGLGIIDVSYSMYSDYFRGFFGEGCNVVSEEVIGDFLNRMRVFGRMVGG